MLKNYFLYVYAILWAGHATTYFRQRKKLKWYFKTHCSRWKIVLIHLDEYKFRTKNRMPLNLDCNFCPIYYNMAVYDIDIYYKH